MNKYYIFITISVLFFLCTPSLYSAGIHPIKYIKINSTTGTVLDEIEISKTNNKPLPDFDKQKNVQLDLINVSPEKSEWNLLSLNKEVIYKIIITPQKIYFKKNNTEWRVNVSSDFISQLFFYKNKVFFIGLDYSNSISDLYCVDILKKEITWKVSGQFYIYQYILFIENNVIVADGNLGVYHCRENEINVHAYNINSGQEKWKRNIKLEKSKNTYSDGVIGKLYKKEINLFLVISTFLLE